MFYNPASADIALIGQGGMGEVYRARATDSRRFFRWQPLLLCGVI